MAKIHKADKFIFGYRISRCTNKYLPKGTRTRLWDKVTCKHCLKMRNK